MRQRLAMAGAPVGSLAEQRGLCFADAGE